MWWVVASVASYLLWDACDTNVTRIDRGQYHVHIRTHGIREKGTPDPRISHDGNVSHVVLTLPHASLALSDLRTRSTSHRLSFRSSLYRAPPHDVVDITTPNIVRGIPMSIVRVHNLRLLSQVTAETLDVRFGLRVLPSTRDSTHGRITPHTSRIFTPVADRRWDKDDYVTFPPLTTSDHLYYCNSRHPNSELFYVRDCYLPGPCEVRCCDRTAVPSSANSDASYPNHPTSLGLCSSSTLDEPVCESTMPYPTCASTNEVRVYNDEPHVLIAYPTEFEQQAMELKGDKEADGFVATLFNVSSLGVPQLFDNAPAYALWDYLRAEYTKANLIVVYLLGDVSRVPTIWFPDHMEFADDVANTDVDYTDLQARVDGHLASMPNTCRDVPHCHMGPDSPHSVRAADNVYGLLEGNDAFLDAVVTRFPAYTTDELDGMLLRGRAYRTKTAVQQMYYRLGMLVGSNEGSGVGYGGAHDAGFHRHYIAPLLRGEAYSTVVLEQGVDDLNGGHIDTLAPGQGILMYTGHGSRVSTSAPYIGQSTLADWEVQRIVQPLWINVGCNVGEYYFSEGTPNRCFQETTLRTGSAIVSMGSSKYQSWAPPMYAQYGIADGVSEGVRFYDLIMHSLHYMNVMQGRDGVLETLFWNVAGDVALRFNTPVVQPRATYSPSHIRDVYQGARCCETADECRPVLNITDAYHAQCGAVDPQQTRTVEFDSGHNLSVHYSCDAEHIHIPFECQEHLYADPPHPSPPPTPPSPPSPPYPPGEAPLAPPPYPPVDDVVFYQVTCGGGVYDNEIGWTLVCVNDYNADLATEHAGGATDGVLIGFQFPCTCTLEMTDSYGDGWNGATWNLLDTSVASITLSTSALGSATFSLP